MNVLIAPNAFKNAVTADEAARAIERGIHAADPGHSCIRHPIADGGDGTGELLMQYMQAERIFAMASGPFGEAVQASFGWQSDSCTAIIDMSTASGIRLIPEKMRNPLKASSYGTGELMRAALDLGAKKIILGMGGSATVDGGMGILRALGLVFTDHAGRSLQTPDGLERLANIDISQLDKRILTCDIIILCDVNSPLLGPDGAAAVFGPQKGASQEMVVHLDASLSHMSEIACLLTGRSMSAVPFAGTAGGAAAGLYALVNARLVHGIEYFLDATSFDEKLADADLVITGEGSLDSQTLHGKGPFGVARRAKLHGKHIVALSGRVDDPEHKLKEWFDISDSINTEIIDLETALQHTEKNLEAASKRCILTIMHQISAGKFDTTLPENNQSIQPAIK